MIKNDQQSAQELAKFYNQLNLIFNAILAPPLVAFVWLYLESNAGNILPVLDNESTSNILNFTIPILIIGMIVLAFFVFKSGLRTIDPAIELISKASVYREKSMLLYGILEVSLMLSVLGYYLTQEGVFLGMYMLVLVFFSLYKPTLGRIAKHLNLKGDDQKFLINCRSIARGEEKEEVIKE